MVDALRRAQGMVTPDGAIVDVHPTAVPASLDVAGERIGPLEAEDANARHTAADIAVTTAIGEGLYAVTSMVDFSYHTYGDSIEELRDHIAATWRSSRISEETVGRTRRVMERLSAPVRPRVTEHVRLTVLRVISPGRRPGKTNTAS